jgi:hypothetical protein
VERNLNTNLKNVFDANLTNIISVRFRYYLDYNMVKNKFTALKCNIMFFLLVYYSEGFFTIVISQLKRKLIRHLFF